MLTGAFFHDGAWSSFRRRHHGRPVDTATLPGWKFLGYLQDHDQIGNRAVGDRISATLSPGLLAVGATLVLTSPFTPMLFMGEEWGASTPWQFFTSHPEPELGKATAEGRIGEFAEHGWDADVVPDPQDPETFTRSKLDWSELSQEPHERLLAVHRALLALRRAHPDLRRPRPDRRSRSTWDDADRWLVVHRGSLRVVVNLADQPREIDLDRRGGRRPVRHRRAARPRRRDGDAARGERGRAQHPLTCAGCCPTRPSWTTPALVEAYRLPAGPVAAGELRRLAGRRDRRRRAQRAGWGPPATGGSSSVLRALADVVLVGHGTASAEGYRPITADSAVGRLRTSLGRPADGADRRRLAAGVARPREPAGHRRRLPHDPGHLRVRRRRTAGRRWPPPA